MPLPNRAYYSFPDVLEHLKRDNINCSMSDLLHFALIGSIEAVIYVVGDWVYEEEETNKSALCKPRHDTDDSDIIFITKVKPKNIKTYLCTINISEWEAKNKNTESKSSLFIGVEGFLSLHPLDAHSFYSDLNLYGETDMLHVVLTPPTEDYGDNTPSNEDKLGTMFYFTDQSISTNDLHITRSEFELLKKGGRKNLLHNIKLDIDKPPLSPHPKTSNAQAKVIKALIEAIGGKHAVNHPRNAIDNPNSELNKALDREGVKFPASGVTVEKWLKGID
ncbi:hypothetical protein QL374_002001 [Salmonella enterica]|nr:hypothetical protein [Salmonella enterica]ELW6561750.1 hypothetical protein [Salmonella enterica]ELZ1402457.1 hypothetical protein [Salmonella enterica]